MKHGWALVLPQAWGPARSSRPAPARVALVAQLALLVATAMTSLLVYAAAQGGDVRATGVGMDLAALAVALGVLRRTWSHLGLGSLARATGATGATTGPGSNAWLVTALLASALLVTLITQELIPLRGEISLDERQYLQTLREGFVRHGVAPFHQRWLVPYLAGRWNVTPLADAEALAALNFACLVIAAGYLSLLVVRLGAPWHLAALAPVFLLSSYLGAYAAQNRLLVDPFNYAMYVLLAHALVRRAHLAYVGPLLLVACLASEKALYWLPVLGLVSWLRAASPWTRAALVAALRAMLVHGWPAVVYSAAIRVYAPGDALSLTPCLDNVHYLSLSSFDGVAADPRTSASNFRALWFPFGAFTAFGLLGLGRSPRWMMGIAALLVPVFLQAHLACDTRRMMAYAFIVYLPLGYAYLRDALAAMPRALAATAAAGLALTMFAGRYLGAPLAELMGQLSGGAFAPSANAVRGGLAAAETALVLAILLVHHAVAARPGAPAPR